MLRTNLVNPSFYTHTHTYTHTHAHTHTHIHIHTNMHHTGSKGVAVQGSAGTGLAPA